MIESWSGTEKALHTSLNYEIRLRKLTFTQVKASCALFKQKKLSIAEKKRNLLSLISTQLEFKTQAEMVDLECAIKEASCVVESESGDESEDEDVEESDSSKDDVPTNDDIWPPLKGQFVYGLFEDGVFPGEVIRVFKKKVKISILVPAKVAKII